MGESQFLDVKFMGGFCLTDHENRNLLPRSKKATAILAYLVFNCGKPISRTKLLNFCWPDASPEKASASLRQCLSKIRKSFGEHFGTALRASRNDLFFQPNSCSFDLWSTNGTIKYETNGEFLEDLDPVSETFDDWIFENRRFIHASQIKQAENDLGNVEPSDSAKVIDITSSILRLDPTNEPTARKLFKAQYELQKFSELRRCYEDLENSLHADGFEVSSETQNLFKDLLSQQVVSNLRTASRSSSFTIPTLVIQSFNAMKSTEEESITTIEFIQQCVDRFSQIPEIKLVDETAFHSKASQEWQKNHFSMNCMVSEHNKKSSLFIRIQSTHTKEIIWSYRETFSRNYTLFQISKFIDTIVSGVVSSIERFMATKMPLNDDGEQSAYYHYLKAKQVFFAAETPDFMLIALRELEKARRKEPNFELPYVHLIQSYNTGSFHTQPGLDIRPGRQKAIGLAEKLLSINSQHPNSHIAMAWCQLWKENFQLAERHIEKAISLKPYEPHRLNSIGTMLVFLGRNQDGEEFYNRASELMLHDLDFQRSDYGELFYLRGDFLNALAWLDYGERRTPYRTLFWRAATLAQLGRLTEAKENILNLKTSVEPTWMGPRKFNSNDVVNWYLKTMKYKNESDSELLLDGLSKAGVRISGF